MIGVCLAGELKKDECFIWGALSDHPMGPQVYLALLSLFVVGINIQQDFFMKLPSREIMESVIFFISIMKSVIGRKHKKKNGGPPRPNPA